MFITFEGVEGSSKTTQAKLLSDWLTSKNITNISTKEPGTIFSKECQQIRHLLLSPDNNLSPRAELLLYLADRAQHVENCIKPALKENKWVICDRYSWSTYAYQGFGRGLINELGDFFKEMLHYSAGNLWPDLTFIMDVPVELGLQRAKKSNDEFKGGDRIENEELEFHQKIREGFISIANKHPNKCIIIDATKSIKELHEEIKIKIDNLITK
jgi:dTMP kinase